MWPSSTGRSARISDRWKNCWTRRPRQPRPSSSASCCRNWRRIVLHDPHLPGPMLPRQLARTRGARTVRASLLARVRRLRGAPGRAGRPRQRTPHAAHGGRGGALRRPARLIRRSDWIRVGCAGRCRVTPARRTVGLPARHDPAAGSDVVRLGRHDHIQRIQMPPMAPAPTPAAPAPRPGNEGQGPARLDRAPQRYAAGPRPRRWAHPAPARARPSD